MKFIIFIVLIFSCQKIEKTPATLSTTQIPQPSKPSFSQRCMISEFGTDHEIFVKIEEVSLSKIRNFDGKKFPEMIRHLSFTSSENSNTITFPINNSEIRNVWCTLFGILIWTSDGSGGYPQLDKITHDNGNLIHENINLEFPKTKGYGGRDEFSLSGNFLSRKWPIYKENDPNCCPSGGIREIKYEMSSTLIFKLLN